MPVDDMLIVVHPPNRWKTGRRIVPNVENGPNLVTVSVGHVEPACVPLAVSFDFLI